jgi:hypothetical protein
MAELSTLNGALVLSAAKRSRRKAIERFEPLEPFERDLFWIAAPDAAGFCRRSMKKRNWRAGYQGQRFLTLFITVTIRLSDRSQIAKMPEFQSYG